MSRVYGSVFTGARSQYIPSTCDRTGGIPGTGSIIVYTGLAPASGSNIPEKLAEWDISAYDHYADIVHPPCVDVCSLGCCKGRCFKKSARNEDT